MLQFLHLKGVPILEQLQLEERLLQLDDRNWCLINEGSTPAIVMGISGKPELLIDQEKLKKEPLPLIKRFSGGGTVVVDQDTLFVTFIFQKERLPFPAYPEPILRWTETLYKEVFPSSEFALRENDYILGERKCGGNAQYIKKTRWLHHTSFLWNYEKTRMEYLLHPPKTPQYRAGRTHEEFLCTLSPHFPSKAAFFDSLKTHLSRQFKLKDTAPFDLPSTSLPTSRITLL
jgi:lipoate-protein ligase A